jgi:predicted 3-demethylubiquinone-9 3-methyltransferase (glyoxalase superfamily)
MSKISPCLWFDGQAEEAANFYVSLLPGSRIDYVQKNVIDSPGGKEGSVLIVGFTLAGETYQALNGGSDFKFNHAISLSIDCKDQAEVDRLWNAFADGGEEVACGWVKDRYGLSWQIVPSVMPKFLADPDREKAARVMQAMMNMVKLDIAALQAAYDGRA